MTSCATQHPMLKGDIEVTGPLELAMLFCQLPSAKDNGFYRRKLIDVCPDGILRQTVTDDWELSGHDNHKSIHEGRIR